MQRYCCFWILDLLCQIHHETTAADLLQSCNMWTYHVDISWHIWLSRQCLLTSLKWHTSSRMEPPSRWVSRSSWIHYIHRSSINILCPGNYRVIWICCWESFYFAIGDSPVTKWAKYEHSQPACPKQCRWWSTGHFGACHTGEGAPPFSPVTKYVWVHSKWTTDGLQIWASTDSWSVVHKWHHIITCVSVTIANLIYSSVWLLKIFILFLMTYSQSQGQMDVSNTALAPMSSVGDSASSPLGATDSTVDSEDEDDDDDEGNDSDLDDWEPEPLQPFTPLNLCECHVSSASWRVNLVIRTESHCNHCSARDYSRIKQ